MKYPKLFGKKDRRRKLTFIQILKLKILYKLGYSYRKIAKKLKVSKSLVMYYVNPKYREQEKRRDAIRCAERWADKDFREKYKKIDRESHFYRHWISKKYRKWNRIKSLQRYYQNKLKKG